MQQPSWTACQLRESILLRSQATDYGTLECAILTRDANLQFWRLRRAVPLHSAKFQLSVISASVAVLCPVLCRLGRRLCCQNCCQRHASSTCLGRRYYKPHTATVHDVHDSRTAQSILQTVLKVADGQWRPWALNADPE